MKAASMWRLLLLWLLKCYFLLPQTFPTSGGIISHVLASAKTRRCWIDGWLFSSFLNKSYTTLIVSSLLTFFSFSYNIVMSRIICHLQVQYTKYLTTGMFQEPTNQNGHWRPSLRQQVLIFQLLNCEAVDGVPGKGLGWQECPGSWFWEIIIYTWCGNISIWTTNVALLVCTGPVTSNLICNIGYLLRKWVLQMNG